MSWLGYTKAIWGIILHPEEQARVDLGKLGEIDFLRYYLKPGHEKLALEEIGRRIDDGLVEYIRLQLISLKLGDFSIEDFTSSMHKIREAMEDNPALKAFAAALHENWEFPLASRAYLEMAKGFALYGRQQLPTPEEGRQFARVLLVPFMDEASWERDWDIRSFARDGAGHWLDSRDSEKLRFLILASDVSPLAWDTLQLICQQLYDRGEEHPPHELLQWSFKVHYGRLKRPDAGSAPSKRPRKLGYMIRNSEIKHTMDLLAQAGMTKTNGHYAVSKAVHLSVIRIRRICQKPYWTIDQFREEAMKSIEPSFYSFLYGSAPDSKSFSST